MNEPRLTSALTVGVKSEIAKRNDRLTWEFYADTIKVLEAAKNQVIPQETIRVWFNEFRSMGWSNDDVFRAADAVKRMETYGGVRFDHFLNGEKVYTQHEVEALIVRAVAAKLQSFGTLDELALYREGLRQAETNYYARVERFMNEVREKEEGGTEALKQWFLGADEGTQNRVIELVAAKNPAIASDKYYPKYKIEFTKLLIHTVASEVEKLRNV